MAVGVRRKKEKYELLYPIDVETNYWHRQTADKPLFPDMLWSRPENRATAGKLLIIGGNLHGFAAPAEAYKQAVTAGIGTARVLLPDATKKLIGPIMENGEFAPSTPSGSFSQLALADFLEHSAWSDGVLLAGELGRNSETAIALEQFSTKYHGQLSVTRDAIDYFKNTPSTILNRPQTTLVLSIAQLQKLTISIHFPLAITLGMDMLRLVEALHELSSAYPANILVKQHEALYAACSGQVSSTRLKTDMPIWRVRVSAAASVWWLQNQIKPFEAITTAIYTIVSPAAA